ncbi:MAG: polysaccharide deacetylase family protein [Acidobacteria bacterium]|nr:polysaccharide deacetylase family protein [Acidobacteriota bacterium]
MLTSLMVDLAIGLLIIVGCGTALAYLCMAPTSQLFGPALTRGPAESRNVVLTFDDGPAPPFTEQILDILSRHKISATFFLCGKNVERYPEIARRIVREGHTIGNHTYSHPFLCLHGRRFIAREIDRAQEAIERVTGVRPALFRPPYGARWFGLMPILSSRGLVLVTWSVAGFDWKYGTQAIVRATTRRLHPGAVILLHDGHEQPPAGGIDQSSTVEALPAIIEAVIGSGLSFAPIESIMAHAYAMPRSQRF